MPSDRVVIAIDVLGGFHSRFFDVGERAAFEQFGMVAAEQALVKSVVVSFTSSAHRLAADSSPAVNSVCSLKCGGNW